MTRVKMELLTDIDTLLDFEKGITGGVSVITIRYAQVYNRDTTNYDDKLPTSHIMHWDPNNMYGF